MRGKTGCSMNGHIKRVSPQEYEWNYRYCPTCGSVKGEPCADPTKTKGRKDPRIPMTPTHRTLGQIKPFEPLPDPPETPEPAPRSRSRRRRRRR